MKYKILIVFILFFSVVKAEVFLMIPEELEKEELNKDEKDKYQNVDYRSSTNYTIKQYKGDLKFKYGKIDSHLKDARFNFSFGGRITFPTATTLTSNLENDSYRNKENIWKYKIDYNYFFSIGLYWPNGVRTEIEYSSMVLETKNFGDSFQKYNNITFNQYLQDGSTFISAYNDDGEANQTDDDDNEYSSLTGNMQPLVEFSIRTIMFNIILEKVQAHVKLKPYIGAGIGYAIGNMRSLQNKGSSKVPAAQFLIGLSYDITDDRSFVLYLGYRLLYLGEMKQKFTRIQPGSGANFLDANDILRTIVFDGETYYNPIFKESEEKFQIMMHNIDLGFRFFF